MKIQVLVVALLVGTTSFSANDIASDYFQKLRSLKLFTTEFHQQLESQQIGIVDMAYQSEQLTDEIRKVVDVQEQIQNQLNEWDLKLFSELGELDSTLGYIKVDKEDYSYLGLLGAEFVPVAMALNMMEEPELSLKLRAYNGLHDYNKRLSRMQKRWSVKRIRMFVNSLNRYLLECFPSIE